MRPCAACCSGCKPAASESNVSECCVQGSSRAGEALLQVQQTNRPSTPLTGTLMSNPSLLTCSGLASESSEPT